MFAKNLSLLRAVLRKTKSFLKIPLKQKCWLIILWPLSGIFRFAMLFIPFRYFSKYYGNYYQNYQLSTLLSPTDIRKVADIRASVHLIAKSTPWQSKCLVQALMARTLLGFYKISYVLHIGVLLTKNEQEPIKAHAWLKVGPYIITGRERHKSFTILASYISKRITTTPPVKNYKHERA